MKATLKAYSFLFLFTFCLTFIARAGDEPLVEKSKTYTKSYPLGSNERVSINNQFGDVKISTWDKNEVKVEVTMTGKANTEQFANEILDRLSVEDGKNNSGVYFRTKIGNWENNRKNNNTGFSINYIVYLPSKNPLAIDNQFGKTILGDFDGELTVNQQFGVFTGGKLGNVKKLHIEFSGGSSVESIDGGDVNVKFSRTQILKMTGTVKANFEHCGGVKLGLDNNLKSLTIKNSFNELNLEVSTNLSASFDIHTSFAEVDNKSNISIKETGDDDDSKGPKFDHDYTGKSGSGSIPIKIRTEFGQVTIGHTISFDPNEEDDKKEKKEKKKTRSV